jgi:hypothetical protein
MPVSGVLSEVPCASHCLWMEMNRGINRDSLQIGYRSGNIVAFVFRNRIEKEKDMITQDTHEKVSNEQLDLSQEGIAEITDVLRRLMADVLTRYFRAAHEICERYNNVATTSLIEVWIDQTERRTWFLAEVNSER